MRKIKLTKTEHVRYVAEISTDDIEMMIRDWLIREAALPEEAVRGAEIDFDVSSQGLIRGVTLSYTITRPILANTETSL